MSTINLDIGNRVINLDLKKTGPTGNKGWSPQFSVVSDGERRVLQVTDWTGGEGTKPDVGDYIGATGFEPHIEDAVDIRGEIGPQGESGLLETVNELGSVSGAISIDLDSGTYITATLTGAVNSISFSNLPASGKVLSFVLAWSGAESITWPVGTIFAGGSAPSITGPDYEIACSIDSAGILTVHGVIDEYATV